MSWFSDIFALFSIAGADDDDVVETASHHKEQEKKRAKQAEKRSREHPTIWDSERR